KSAVEDDLSAISETSGKGTCCFEVQNPLRFFLNVWESIKSGFSAEINKVYEKEGLVKFGNKIPPLGEVAIPAPPRSTAGLRAG
ncbi:MAG TPA: hypothetical protein PK674_02270, partial [Candidatus Absconditabacterales bacterium]|nr:hypothetical protein [Candidatus Absconditabacterales bacterium]